MRLSSVPWTVIALLLAVSFALLLGSFYSSSCHAAVRVVTCFEDYTLQQRPQTEGEDIATHRGRGGKWHHPKGAGGIVTTTRSMAIHAIPQTTRFNNHGIREDTTHAISEPNLVRRRGSCVHASKSAGQQIGINMVRACLTRT